MVTLNTYDKTTFLNDKTIYMYIITSMYECINIYKYFIFFFKEYKLKILQSSNILNIILFNMLAKFFFLISVPIKLFWDLMYFNKTYHNFSIYSWRIWYKIYIYFT